MLVCCRICGWTSDLQNIHYLPTTCPMCENGSCIKKVVDEEEKEEYAREQYLQNERNLLKQKEREAEEMRDDQRLRKCRFFIKRFGPDQGLMRIPCKCIEVFETYQDAEKAKGSNRKGCTSSYGRHCTVMEIGVVPEGKYYDQFGELKRL